MERKTLILVEDDLLAANKYEAPFCSVAREQPLMRRRTKEGDAAATK